MRHAVETLDELGVANEAHVLSAHRTPVQTTDFARNGAQTLHQIAQKAGLNTSWHDTPGPHYYLIWRVFLGDFASMLFR